MKYHYACLLVNQRFIKPIQVANLYSIQEDYPTAVGVLNGNVEILRQAMYSMGLGVVETPRKALYLLIYKCSLTLLDQQYQSHLSLIFNSSQVCPS